jgi:hypothetical protein
VLITYPKKTEQQQQQNHLCYRSGRILKRKGFFFFLATLSFLDDI